MNESGKASDPLPVGTVALVRRINGEAAQGVIAGPPIAHLKHIGEFYLLAKAASGSAPYWRGTGRKSKERLLWEAQQGFIGMYERSELRFPRAA